MVDMDASIRIYLQYYEREINLTRLVEKAYREACSRNSEPVNQLEVYVKPEDGKAYYVANKRLESYVNLWDSDRDMYDGKKLSGEIHWNNEIERRLIFEYRGRQCDCDSIIYRIVDKLKNVYTTMTTLDEMEVYIRQEHETAFYVVNGRHTGSVSMFA